MTLAELESEIRNLKKLADGALQDSREWKGTWRRIKFLTNEFRRIDFPSRSDRQNAWSLFDATVREIKATYVRHLKEQAETVPALEREFHGLELQVASAKEKADWETIAASLLEMEKRLWSTRLPSKQLKMELWNRLRALQTSAEQRRNLP